MDAMDGSSASSMILCFVSPYPEHAEMLVWAGGAFDPDKVDLPGINGMLKIFQSSLERQAQTK